MQLIPENDARLKTPCAPYDYSQETQAVRTEKVDAMIQLMQVERGVGLAAPQVGLMQRFFVINDGTATFPCYNPEIVESGKEQVADNEGCLSFPGLYFKVPRAQFVVGKFQDLAGQVVTKRFEGLAARCFQHELEHLNGVCFVNKVGPVTLSMAQKRRSKNRKAK